MHRGHDHATCDTPIPHIHYRHLYTFIYIWRHPAVRASHACASIHAWSAWVGATIFAESNMEVVGVYGVLWGYKNANATDTRLRFPGYRRRSPLNRPIHNVQEQTGPAGLGIAGSARPAPVLAPVCDRSTASYLVCGPRGARAGQGIFTMFYSWY